MRLFVFSVCCLLVCIGITGSFEAVNTYSTQIEEVESIEVIKDDASVEGISFNFSFGEFDLLDPQIEHLICESNKGTKCNILNSRLRCNEQPLPLLTSTEIIETEKE